MRWSINIKKATICLAQIKLATIVTTIIVASSIAFVMGDNLDFPAKVKAAVEQGKIELPAAAPVAFISLSHELFPSVERANSDRPAAAPLTVSAAPVRLQTNSHQIAFNPTSRAPAAFYGFQRRLEANVDRISFNTPSLAPMAFVRFCIKYAPDCEVRRMAFRPRPLELTEARRGELATINRNVNRAIRPQANNKGVMDEEWLVSPREGDCNDYAVTKRHELLAHGWPSRALLLAEVVVPSGEHHLILIVRSREDDLVLDNLNWNVRPVSQIRYQWVRAQQENNPKFWSTIDVTRATRIAMNSTSSRTR